MTNFRVLLAGLLAFLSTGMSLAQSPETKIRFSVLDEQNLVVKDLKADDLRILIDKKPVLINSLKLSGELPLRVLVLIDCSVSQDRTLPVEKLFAAAFIDQILKRNVDSLGVAKFSTSVDVLSEPGSDFEALKTKLNFITVEKPTGYIGGIVLPGRPPITPGNGAGSTSIFDAVDQAISLLAQKPSDGKRNIVLLISDGVNTAGQKKFKDRAKAWRLSDVAVYAIGIGDTNYDGVDGKTLKKISEATGGLAIIPTKKSADTDVTKLRNAMRFVYEALTTSLGALPADISDVSVEFTSTRIKDKKLQVNSVSVR